MSKQLPSLKLWNLVLPLLVSVSTVLFAQPDEYLSGTFRRHNAPVQSVAISPDGRLVATGGDDKTIYIWDITTLDIRHTISGLPYTPKSIRFTGEGALLFASGPDLRLIDMEGKSIKNYSGYTTHIWSLDYHQPTGQVIAGSYSPRIIIWDFQQSGIKQNLEGHNKSTLAVAISPDGVLAATGSLDQTVRLWDLSGLGKTFPHGHHSANIMAVAFHPSGKYLASASADNTICLWAADSMRLVHQFTGHDKGVLAIAFSPDGHYMASASVDQTIILWGVSEKEKIYSFIDHSGNINALAFSPDGNVLVSASDDRTARTWRLNKSIFANHYVGNAIEQELEDSGLFRPKQKEETRQQFAEREARAKKFKEEIYEKYYREYLKKRDGTK